VASRVEGQAYPAGVARTRQTGLQRLDALVPAFFVVLWSSGFVTARVITPYADPLPFLAVRFASVVAIMGGIALATRAAWPARGQVGHVAVVGIMLHGVYLGGVFVSVAHGTPAGVSAVIVGLQPILTAAVAWPLLRERITAAQWLGLTAGFAGVALVVADRVALSRHALDAAAYSVLALVGITVGTLYQKRFAADVDVRSGAVVQYAAATAAMLLAMGATGETHIEFTLPLLAALVWLVLVLSIGAVTLLMVLIRRGSAARTASLFYLTPALAAIQGWLFYDERLGPVVVAGIALTALGVAVVQRVRPA
jgi:drug/metabolite transporter (DMT)-like permease